MAKLEHVINGVAAFAEKELLTVLTGAQLWTGSFGLGVLKSQAPTIFSSILQSPTVSMLNLVDGNGDIKIDVAIDAAKSASKKCKLNIAIPLVGTFKLGETEFDKLRTYIEEAAKQQPPHGENESG